MCCERVWFATFFILSINTLDAFDESLNPYLQSSFNVAITLHFQFRFIFNSGNLYMPLLSSPTRKLYRKEMQV